MTEDDDRHPKYDPRYKDVPEELLPLTESLKITIDRVVPYWNEVIMPQIKEGRKVLIAAHGNSLRALVKHIDNISDEDIVELNIPTGIPLVYEFDDDLKPIRNYYLGDPEKIKEKIDAVKKQGKK